MERISLFEKQVHPFKQGAVFIVVTIITVLTVYLYQSGKEEYINSSLSWELALSILLAFAVFNSVMSLSYKDQNNYWFYSTLVFFGLAGLGAGLAYLTTDLTDKQFVIFKWLYFVFTFGYLVFLSIVRAMKKIVEIAQRQDARLRGEE